MPPTNFSLAEILRYDAVIAFLASFITCLLLVCTKKWHGTFSMDSSIGVQKVHTSPTPRIGGISIFIGISFGLIASIKSGSTGKSIILQTIFLAGIPAFIFGLLEDITKKISVSARLIATITSGILGCVITGISITSIDIPLIDWLLGYTLISILFTAFAIGGVANSINIIDGLNGLTAGAALIMLTSFGFIANQVGDHQLALTCLLIAASVFGFFLFNWPNGNIFLGDGGAYFLGFTLAWIAVLLPERNSTLSPWTSLLICSYPIIEVGFSIFRRKFWRQGYSATQPDAFHLHTLAKKRWSKKIFSNTTNTLQNGLTSPILWIYSLISCTTAACFYQSKTFTFLSLIICLVIYISLYSKLAFFRWIPKK